MDTSNFDDMPADAPLTDRVNAEPAILRGLSSTESWFAIVGSFLIWVPISLVIGFLVHHLQISVIFMGAGPIFTVWILSGWLQRVKRNHPDYYYQHRLKQWLSEKGLIKHRFVTHNGVYDLGRSFPSSFKTRKPRKEANMDDVTSLDADDSVEETTA